MVPSLAKLSNFLEIRNGGSDHVLPRNWRSRAAATIPHLRQAPVELAVFHVYLFYFVLVTFVRAEFVTDGLHQRDLDQYNNRIAEPRNGDLQTICSRNW